MHSMKKLAAALVVAGAVSGCAVQVPRQAFNAAAASHIKTVVVTQSPNQDKYEAADQAKAHAGVAQHGGFVLVLIG